MAEILRVWLRRLIPVLMLGLVALLGYANLMFVENAPAQTPFVARWTGLRAWLTQGTSPYDPSVSQESQVRMYGRPANPARGEDPQHFLYPPAVAVYLGPLAFLSLPIARAVWMSLLQIAIVALPLVSAIAFRWSMGGWMRVGSVALGLFSLPGFLVVLNGDIAAVVSLAIVLSLTALHRRRDAAAGLLAATAIVKPQLGLLYLVYLYVWGIRQRRWTLIGWMTTGLAILLGVSTALLPIWPLDVARQVLDYGDIPTLRSAVSWILGTTAQPYSGVVGIGSALILGYLFWEWRLSFSGGERGMVWGAMLTLTVTAILSPFAVLANQLLLIPPILLAVSVWHARLGPGRESVLAFIVLALGLATWAGASAGLDAASTPAASIILPPILVGIALWWVRWWATKLSLPREGLGSHPS
jgi:Glycosyltransferase family 87